MVSETLIHGGPSAMSDDAVVCSDFSQHAWKKDVCCNCQRPRDKHLLQKDGQAPAAGKGGTTITVGNHEKAGSAATTVTISGPDAKVSADTRTNSPKPAKRNSIMTKSWTSTQPDGKSEISEEEQWNSMCLPDPDQPNKRLDGSDKTLVKHPSNVDRTKTKAAPPEHSYEDIDSEMLRGGQRSNKSHTKSAKPGHDYVNTKENTTVTQSAQKTTISINPEERLSSLIQNDPQLPSNSDLRSRSSSREKSPAPAPKPKVSDKPKVSSGKNPQDLPKTQKEIKPKVTKTLQSKESNAKSSPKIRKKGITFVEKDPSVIGDDGGLDNLYSDAEDDDQSELGQREALEMSEQEKDWAMQALRNTLWNQDHINDSDKPVKTNHHSKEFEDINKVADFSAKLDGNAHDNENAHDGYNFGTFPLKKKSEKSVMDNMFSNNRLSTLTESTENMTEFEDKYESVLKFLGEGKLDLLSSPKRKKSGENAEHVYDMTESSYDDPWEDKFEFGDGSDMNLLDEIKGEIDLDSSSAGFALVDLLNDVLANYSTGTPSECDSVRNLDLLDEKLEKLEKLEDKGENKGGKVKNTELEAKMVTLAANLRKHRAKGRAPRPPSCPPEPPQDVSKSPAKQAELRAAQSKEPTFKMVPLGKSIGPNVMLQAANSTATLPGASTSKPDISSTSSSNSSELDGFKGKNEKQSKKASGGIGGFFSKLFGRGKDSDAEVTASSETLVSNICSMSDPYTEVDSVSDKGALSEKRVNEKGDNSKEKDKANVKSSPQMKMKVLPNTNRPVSPRPLEKPPSLPDGKKEIDKDSSSSQKDSPKVKAKTKDNVKTEKSDKNASQQNSSPKNEQGKSKHSPTKASSDGNKEVLKATSPKSKEAPPLPLNPPREVHDGSAAAPKPRARGNPEPGAPRSRPRKRDSFDGKPRDTPGVPPPKPPVAMKPKQNVVATKSLDNTDSTGASANVSNNVTAQNQGSRQRLSSASSLEETKTDEIQKRTEIQRSTDPKVLRKRAKSPKRFAAPLAPGRSSLPNILTDSNASLASNASEMSIQSLPNTQSESKPESKGLSFARELEQKLQKEQGSGSSEHRKPPALPTTAPKVDNLEKSKSLPAEKQKPASSLDKSKSLPADTKKGAIKEADAAVASGRSSPKEATRSRSASKDDLKITPPTSEDKTKTLPTNLSASSSTNNPETDQSASSTGPITTTCTSTTTSSADTMEIHTEKIELPKQVSSSRKSFLGKLNRSKNKPPPPPSVKRTKSITESTLLGDHHLKKIDVKDISAPVLITEMSSSKAVNRRNTITIPGDDNSFLSGGSTSSGSTSAGEKCDISPRGSVDNLYEFIKSEAPMPPAVNAPTPPLSGTQNDGNGAQGAQAGERKHFYDPVVENTSVVGLRPPSMTGSEGYLEPVRSNLVQSEPVNSNMAESTASIGSMTTSFVAMTSNMADMNKSTNENFESPYSKTNLGLDNLDISEERRAILANQPIYEEITNSYGKLGASEENTSTSRTEEFQEEVYGVHTDQAPQNFGVNLNTVGSSLKKKDSFSSDSERSSASNSLSRPRPIPRKRPRQIGSGFEQYVAMNKPGVAVVLNEDQLREMLGTLTAMNLNTIKEIYTQHEKCFTKENLHLGSVGPLKWHDFDIYGKPLHATEKCVVYNAKMRTTMSPCQLMLLHSRPEITAANHPSLLKPTCIFTDSVPFTYLTEEFIKTSQILQTTVNQSNSNMAKCYIAVGLFDITESLTHHMNSLETICENQKDFLRKVLFTVLQLLSAISHCMEQGHPLSETDFHDLYLISNPYCLGETVSFLPQARSPDDQHIDRVCLFLEKFLQDMCAKCEANSVLDDSAFFTFSGIQRIMELLEAGVVECLPIVRSYTEFLLWGPAESDPNFQDLRHSNIEPKLSMWLERQRSELIHDFARRVQHGARCNIKDFYMMKFLLKASAGGLLECIRCHASVTSS